LRLNADCLQRNESHLIVFHVYCVGVGSKGEGGVGMAEHVRHHLSDAVVLDVDEDRAGRVTEATARNMCLKHGRQYAA
jgi:hypothetical protein